MLVLSREVGERVICTLPDGQTIEIMPVRISADKVRLGITAAPEIEIDREEVIERKKQTEAVLTTNG
jgi:carbon storage regulator CsrA